MKNNEVVLKNFQEIFSRILSTSHPRMHYDCPGYRAILQTLCDNGLSEREAKKKTTEVMDLCISSFGSTLMKFD